MLITTIINSFTIKFENKTFIPESNVIKHKNTSQRKSIHKRS